MRFYAVVSSDVISHVTGMVTKGDILGMKQTKAYAMLFFISYLSSTETKASLCVISSYLDYLNKYH